MNTVGRRAFLAAIALIAPDFRASPARSRSRSMTSLRCRRVSPVTTIWIVKPPEVFLKNLLATPGNIVRLARPDAALERDIIVAWYTGVHQVRGEAQLVTHSGALQWRALGMPAPGTCVGPFGSWAKPHRSPQP